MRAFIKNGIIKNSIRPITARAFFSKFYSWLCWADFAIYQPQNSTNTRKNEMKTEELNQTKKLVDDSVAEIPVTEAKITNIKPTDQNHERSIQSLFLNITIQIFFRIGTLNPMKLMDASDSNNFMLPFFEHCKLHQSI